MNAPTWCTQSSVTFFLSRQLNVARCNAFGSMEKLCCAIEGMPNSFASMIQVEKEREALRFEMNKAAAQMKEADAAIAAQKAELDKLNQIITEADQVLLQLHS